MSWSTSDALYRVGDDEIGVTIGHLGTAEASAPETGLVDQGAPADTSGEGFLKMQPDDWWP